jgi:hypothetical protein
LGLCPVPVRIETEQANDYTDQGLEISRLLPASHRLEIERQALDRWVIVNGQTGVVFDSAKTKSDLMKYYGHHAQFENETEETS